METVVVSKASLYWRRVGIWQVLAILFTFGVSFATLRLTGDKETSAYITAIFTGIVVLISIIATIPGAVIASVIAYAATIPVAFAFMTYANNTMPVLGVLAVSVPTTMAVAIVVATPTANAERYGIKKKRFFCLLYTVEYGAILLSLLLA